jgi:hypothetical protein
LAARPLFPQKVTLATWLEVGFSYICLKPVRRQGFKQPLQGQLEDVDSPDDPSHHYGAASGSSFTRRFSKPPPSKAVLADEVSLRKPIYSE